MRDYPSNNFRLRFAGRMVILVGPNGYDLYRAPVERRFYLDRKVDESGISGTGRVAEGAILITGWVIMQWLTETGSTTFYRCIEDVERIHGHQGQTAIVFADVVGSHGGRVGNGGSAQLHRELSTPRPQAVEAGEAAPANRLPPTE